MENSRVAEANALGISYNRFFPGRLCYVAVVCVVAFLFAPQWHLLFLFNKVGIQWNNTASLYISHKEHYTFDIYKYKKNACKTNKAVP